MTKFDLHLFFHPVSKKNFNPPPLLSTSPPTKNLDPPPPFCPESYTYLGFLFPTLLQLQPIYKQLSNSNDLKFCMSLTSAILADINMRFSHYLMFSDSTQT